MNRPTRIVILGGGFGGVYTARHLEEIFKDAGEVQITLISRDNYFIMTPLLFEAGSGVLEPRHAVNPIRPLLRSAQFVEAEVEGVDLQRKIVSVRRPHAEPDEVLYDHLVLALGSITNTSMIPGSEHALTFKTLGDAIYLRNHIIQLFERADIETDPARKAAMLTFVLVGGGLVAVELAGEIRVFLENISKLYRNVDRAEVRFDLLEAADHIVPEMDRELSDYAALTLSKRGVRIRTNTRVDRMEPGRVHLPDGEVIAADTILLATGVLPSPTLALLPLQKDRKGRVQTEPTMRAAGQQDVWALGDCASIPDPSGHPYPTLAQHAIREALQLAKNIAAAIRGQPLEPFVYKTKGTLAALGHFKGVGKIYKISIRGFVAWWVWRTYYLMRMPNLNRRLRVMMDWTIALMFKNDIVQLDIAREQQLRAKLAAHATGNEDPRAHERGPADVRLDDGRVASKPPAADLAGANDGQVARAGSPNP
jgi:NADH dehydrogenase